LDAHAIVKHLTPKSKEEEEEEEEEHIRIQ
jgi:hypothetical protein